MSAAAVRVTPRHICWDTETVGRVLEWAAGRDDALVALCDAVLAGDEPEDLVFDRLQDEPSIAQDIGLDELVRGWL